MGGGERGDAGCPVEWQRSDDGDGPEWAGLDYRDILDAMEELSPMYRVVFNLYAIEMRRPGNLSQISISEGTSSPITPRPDAREVLRRKLKVSEERKEDDSRVRAAGSFEQGVKSALEKAPGMVVPSWATMQTAMAGGAAGGAAAASWRWIIGPAASVALIGGAIWHSEREMDEPVAESPLAEEVQQEGQGMEGQSLDAMDVADFAEPRHSSSKRDSTFPTR